jgi:hypothetical protein
MIAYTRDVTALHASRVFARLLNHDASDGGTDSGGSLDDASRDAEGGEADGSSIDGGFVDAPQDGGPVDGDAGPGLPADTGCGCGLASSGRRRPTWGLLGLVFVAARLRRPRR